MDSGFRESGPSMKQNHVGIIGVGVYIPNQVVTAKEISTYTQGVWSEQAIIEKLGFTEKRVPNDHEGTQEMGALAAIKCIEDAKIDPLEIDVILCFGEEWKEYPLTTSALYIQDRIKATNAWGIDVQNRCATSLAAIKMAKDMLLADDEIDTILVAGGYRNGDFVDYTDKNMSMMYNLGAGGGALLLRKNAGKNIILGTHLVADGSLALTAGVEIGGQCHPITKDNIEVANKLRLMDAEKMKNRLNEVSQHNWMHCIKEALRKSNKTIQDIDFLNILHIKRSAHMGMLKDLGLNEDQTIYLEKYGHIGQVDQILSLYLALQEGKVKEGTTMCMIAAGIGYVWAASIVQWGVKT
jgi:3-oxoacyl-[acyl-carrier-protein] synthase III